MQKTTSMNYTIDHISTAIKAAREKKAISQRELSAMAGIPQAQISRFESGAVDLRLSSLVALTRALDLELELVPRKALPAVESIVRSAESREPRTDTVMRNASIELNKLAKILQSAKMPQIPFKETEQALASVRALERLRPSPEALAAIKDLNRQFAEAKQLAIDPEVFAQHAKRLNEIRNQLAHIPAIANAPRPAYSLEEDDDA